VLVASRLALSDYLGKDVRGSRVQRLQARFYLGGDAVEGERGERGGRATRPGKQYQKAIRHLLIPNINITKERLAQLAALGAGARRSSAGRPKAERRMAIGGGDQGPAGPRAG
jgi:hypothetical protein